MTSQTVFEFFSNYLRFLGFLVYVSFAAALAAALEAAFLPCFEYPETRLIRKQGCHNYFKIVQIVFISKLSYLILILF